MSDSLSISQKAQIKSELQLKYNRPISDSQIEAFYKEYLSQQNQPQQQDSGQGGGLMGDYFNPEPVGEKFVGEGAIDFVGGALWSALDTATIGLAGMGLKAAAGEDRYNQWMAELQDTAAGRIGGTVGSLAGFMVPMTGVAKATQGIVSGVKTAQQMRALNAIQKAGGTAKALKAAEKIAKPTTRTLQHTAALKIKKELGNKITMEQAKKLALEQTDDFIGYTTKNIPAWKKYFARGPQAEMAHSDKFIATVKNQMQVNLPERLAVGLSKEGVTLGTKQLAKLSDDMIDLVAKRNFNSIESLIAGQYGSKIATGFSNIMAGGVQEMVNFGIVGTAMDAVQVQMGNIDTRETPFYKKMLEHALVGFGFGTIRFVPGGRSRPLWRDFQRYTGKQTKDLNKKVGDMSLDEAKKWARINMKNDKSVIYKTRDGATITDDMLRKGRGLNKNDLPHLKNQIIKDNNRRLANFKEIFNPLGWNGELRKDFFASLPRMAAGAVLFNSSSLLHDHFEQLTPIETAFHLTLGAVMTKRPKPIIPGLDPKAPGVSKNSWMYGEREYVYNSDLKDVLLGMKSAEMSATHITKIAKQFDGNMWTDYLQKHPTEDITNIKDILIKNNIIYDSNTGSVPEGQGTLLNRDLFNLINPIIPGLKGGGFEINLGASKKQQKAALKAIEKLQSSQLSSEGNVVLLNSANNINRSILEGSKEYWSKMMDELYINFKDQFIALSGDSKVLNEDGTFNIYKLGETKLTPELQEALGKFIRIQQELIRLDIIKPNEISMDKGRGLTYEPTAEKVQQIERIIHTLEQKWGKEFYGENSKDLIDLLDGSMWNQFTQVDYLKNVNNVVMMLRGETPVGMKESDVRKAESLLHEVLSSDKNNQLGVVIDNPNRITIDTKNAEFTSDELIMLDSFLRDIWAIQVANGKNPSDFNNNKNYEVPIGKVRELKEALVKGGLPDPDVHNLDSRWQIWVDKAIGEGINKVTSGLDLSLEHGHALKKLMMNGLAIQVDNTEGRGLGLVMKNKITEGEVRRIKPDATDAQVKEMVEAYDFIVKEFNSSSQKFINFQENLEITGLTNNQLESIITARDIFQSDKLRAKIEKTDAQLNEKIISLNKEYDVLQTQLSEAPDKSSVGSDIQAMMDMNRQVLQEVKNLHMSFVKTYGGNIEMTRASAHIKFMNEIVGKDGKNLFELIEQMEIDPMNFDSYSKQIRDIQVEIANKVANMEGTNYGWSRRMEEQALRMKHQEVEGRIPKEDTNVTPDSFVKDYNIDINKLEGTTPGLTFETPAEAIYDVYQNTVVLGKDPNKFVQIMARATGHFKSGSRQKTPANISDKTRAEILSLVKLFERRFNVKRLKVNVSSGSGTFEAAEISHGWLTDTFSEIFKGETGDMIILGPDFREGNKIISLSGDAAGNHIKVQRVLNSDSFNATLEQGGISNRKHMKSGANSTPDPNADPFLNLDLNKQVISGAHHIIQIDENISLAVPEAGFDVMTKSFLTWHKDIRKTDYVKTAIKKYKGAKDLFKTLDKLAKDLEKSKDGDVYSVQSFKNNSGVSRTSDLIEDTMFKIINVMYGSKIDGNWLQNAYLDQKLTMKEFKYKRLHQNQGYSRNSDVKKKLAFELYKESPNEYHRDLVTKYTTKEDINILVINDSNVSKTGEAANGLLTDNRSVIERDIKRRKNLTDEQKEYMLETIKESHSVNAEQANAPTIVRKSFLDYLLLFDGNSQMIGSSSGQKPVGLSSFTDSNGNIHVFVNKTHYFYDKALDPFFKENPTIDQVAFKSGAKKAQVINPKDHTNIFKPYEPPTLDVAQSNGITNLGDWINTIKVDKTHESVFNAKFNQMLSGTSYGKPKDAKILKQFDNWTGESTAADIFLWSRADMVDQFAKEIIKFQDPENVALASREAKSFIKSDKNKEGTLNAEAENASFASLWLEAEGVPFSVVSRNLYDALLKKRYIDQAGVFDGYTDAGGVPVLRANLHSDLRVPIYQEISGTRTQVKLGEANVTSDYLDRKIHHRGDYGGTIVVGDNIKQRPQYKEKGTITLAYGMEGRDVIIDLKSGEIYDPYRLNANIKSKEYKELDAMITSIRKRLSEKDMPLETWKDLWEEINNTPDKYTNLDLAIMAMPAPRTGPHDAMVVKLRNILDSRDGGLIELNSWDVTMRGQRDYDTDKLPFYMDTPSSAVFEAVRTNGQILEARPTADKYSPNLDLYSNQNFKQLNHKVNEYKRKRGPVLKMHRKISYAERVLTDIGGIKLGDGTEIIFNPNSLEAKQRLVDDSQNVLDIYAQLPKRMEDMKVWADKTLFGNSQRDKANLSDEPFFLIKYKDGKKGVISDRVHKEIVNKFLNDFGSLLNLESNVWEAGEAKTPRYRDMVDYYRTFQNTYNSERINWSYYNFLKKKGLESDANRLFFDNDTKRIQAGNINNILGSLAEKVKDNPTSFLKSLHGVAKKDYLRIQETYSPSGDHFNAQMNKILGQNRAEALLNLQITGELDATTITERQRLLGELWEGYKRAGKHEQRIVQVNTLEGQIRALERVLSQKENQTRTNSESHQIEIDMLKEDIALKTKSLEYVMDKVHLEGLDNAEHSFGQEFIKYKKGLKVKVYNKDIVIRNTTTGHVVKTLKAGTDAVHELRKNEVAVKNPVVLKPIVEHEMLDGVAFANSTLNYWSGFSDYIGEGATKSDLTLIRELVKDVRRDIKRNMSDIMNQKGYRDWDRHDAEVFRIIDNALAQVKRIATEGMDTGGKFSNTFLGELPDAKKTYGQDFLMALLTPDYTGNPNEFHFSPKTGLLMPSVKAPAKSVINGVMKALEVYEVHKNHKDFIQQFAQVHRGYYDAMVGGQGYHSGLSRLAESSFEGALLNQTINKVMFNPYMPVREFKNIKDYVENMPPLESEIAELYRQVIQESPIMDPQTAFNMRKQIIETEGIDVYKSLFKVSRGELVFDGLNTRRFGLNKGEGQLIGEVTMDRTQLGKQQLTGTKPLTRGTSIRETLVKTIGWENENGSGAKGCP